MRFPRRQLLQILSFAFGSNFIVGRNQLGVAAETAAQPAPTTGPGETAVNYGRAGGPAMEKVTGIGGLFFRSHDSAALARWYQQHLGISLIPTSYGESPWQQEATITPHWESRKNKDGARSWRVQCAAHWSPRITGQQVPGTIRHGMVCQNSSVICSPQF